jgi:uncharacterized protein (DUF4415 family)
MAKHVIDESRLDPTDAVDDEGIIHEQEFSPNPNSDFRVVKGYEPHRGNVKRQQDVRVWIEVFVDLKTLDYFKEHRQTPDLEGYQKAIFEALKQYVDDHMDKT